MFFFYFLYLIKNTSDIEEVKFGLNNESDINLPILLMILSITFLTLFYYIHMKRIMKEITTLSPIFDITDNETKMDFTIAERHST